eukprot:TRINITY_DN63225_c0_g1_i1.p1 TRINITY_DN63225_c0_g1~~TRINITY_DN63225_c0_g1_i1.p1  ORF type:complete len:284 (+),score=47.79 TRINITY_DN63225_c0_g1_i1:96-947(+)
MLSLVLRHFSLTLFVHSPLCSDAVRMGNVSVAENKIKLVVIPFRSGSQTLKHTLKDLGYTVFGMGDCVLRYSCLHALQGAREHPIDWAGMVAEKGYDATAGVPSAVYFNEVLDLFPEAKVILMPRDTDSWFRSTSNLLDLMSSFGKSLWFVPRLSQIAAAVAAMIEQEFFKGRSEDPVAAKAAFTEYLEKVRARVPPEQLLELNVADEDALEKLTAFLVLPHQSGPLPRINSNQNEVKYRVGLAVGVDVLVGLAALVLFRWQGMWAVAALAAILGGLYGKWLF